jgi:hypothetical protein
MDRVIAAAEANGDYNNEQERAATLEYLLAAREKFVEKSRAESNP